MEDDQQRRAGIEARNQAESMIHTVEKSLADLGDTVPEDERSKVRSAMDELKAVMEGDDVAAIQEKTALLTQASMKLGEMAYRKAQEDAAGEPDNAGSGAAEEVAPSADDRVVDADFLELEDEDDKKANK